MTNLITIYTDKNGMIEENALIEKTDNLESWAETYNDGNPDFIIIGWEKANPAGDAWIKLHCHPSKHFEINDAGNAIVNGIECTIKAPGTHPGGDAYWLDPAESVLTPILEATDNDIM